MAASLFFETMTRKAEFNAEEWQHVVEGPLSAALLVAAADRGGTLRESLSLGRAYKHAREQSSGQELLDDLIASPPQLDPRSFGSPDELRDRVVQRLREAIGLVEQKADPGEVEAYKRFVMTLADTVAHAHREGGVLGIGGKEVSESEQAALDEIAAVVGQPAD
jgi:hypothetical protein